MQCYLERGLMTFEKNGGQEHFLGHLEIHKPQGYEALGNALMVGEVLKKQEQLYADLSVTSLPAKA